MVDKEKKVCPISVFSSDRTKTKQVQNDIGPTMEMARGSAAINNFAAINN